MRSEHTDAGGAAEAAAASCVSELLHDLAQLAEEAAASDGRSDEGGVQEGCGSEPLVAQLQRAVRTRERILAVVSHDLRDPLAAVTTGAMLLERHLGAAQPHVRRLLGTIQRNVRHMERLIRDLLDLASLRAGRISLAIRWCSVNGLAGEAVALHDAAASAKGVALSLVELSPDEPVLCDDQRMLQVLSNLLGNAIKFCKAGDRVELAARRTDAELELVVADTGPGIATDDLPHVFEPYWSAQRDQSGTGLGLHIVRAIVEAHHGRVRVESAPDRGSIFVLTLPMTARAESA
jgi:signal transduction histidine kinase